eukprot:CAMPEP_0198527470 /NCGR_PEP_ID=MMETSP1462-20131121/24573_1 /TAXON_ID=1333877 /ORGANISM="Brandtodinium nutriculum, Strain RCC3387" /LENGTH=273 /DNA_ID=CAMNT_0044257279 /DNA_START=87 /DNA_END=905 /DNA_ORIENTATION=-
MQRRAPGGDAWLHEREAPPRRGPRAGRTVLDRQDAPAWTRIRTPSPEIMYMPWGTGPTHYLLPPAGVHTPLDANAPGSGLHNGYRALVMQPVLHAESPFESADFQPQRALQSHLEGAPQQQPDEQVQLLDQRGATPYVANEADVAHQMGPLAFGKGDAVGCDSGPGAALGCGEDAVATPRLGPLPSVGGFVPVESPLEDSLATPRLGPMAAVECLAAPSRGSIGHPEKCAPACKYAKKKRGCKDGADCSHCHLCVWHSHRPRFARGSAERHSE